MKRFIQSLALVFSGIFVAVAGNALAVQMEFSPTSFRDVPSDAYFTDSVQELSTKGIIRGYDDGRFGPEDFVTRGQVAVMIRRYDENVVQPMRDQIRKIQMELGLPYEETCPGGHEVGDSFPADDGCNTCFCGKDGMVGCTEKACFQPPPDPKPLPPLGRSCLSNDDCGEVLVCSTSYGDCDSPCAPWEDCIEVCEGVCVPEMPIERVTCGNGICEVGEDLETLDDGSGGRLYCPEDCDGNTGAQCDEANKKLHTLLDEPSYCEVDSDCMLYQQSCPFFSCGTSVNAERMSDLKELEILATKGCENRPMACAMCLDPGKPVCRNNTCSLEKGDVKPPEPVLN